MPTCAGAPAVPKGARHCIWKPVWDSPPVLVMFAAPPAGLGFVLQITKVDKGAQPGAQAIVGSVSGCALWIPVITQRTRV